MSVSTRRRGAHAAPPDELAAAVVSAPEQAAGSAQAGEGATPFEPRIVGFLCNWCSYAGADKAGAAQLPYPPNVRVVRVMCSGRVDPQFILTAFAEGADGVLVLACHPGDCHYKEQNYRAVARHQLVTRMMEAHGIDSRRCRFGFVSAAEAQEFADTITEMTMQLRELGPAGAASSVGSNPSGSSDRAQQRKER